ncbi:MAG: phosphate-starvation-inducible PsiE family protein [Gemmatimonadota bacterium]
MADPAEDAAAAPTRPRGVAGTIWVLEHAQDYIAIAVGVVLLVLAAVLVVSGVVGFFATVSSESVLQAGNVLLDRVLLVLILVEIVHTVVLSLRAHRLAAQPFIVVGLVAVIRRILFLLSSDVKVSVAELGMLIAMVVAFVAGLIAVSRFEKQHD